MVLFGLTVIVVDWTRVDHRGQPADPDFLVPAVLFSAVAGVFVDRSTGGSSWSRRTSCAGWRSSRMFFVGTNLAARSCC